MKEMRDGCGKCGGPHPSLECNDKPIGGPEEEANYAYGGYRGGGYQGNYCVKACIHSPCSNEMTPPSLTFWLRMDVIDEVIEEELDALLNDSEPFLSTTKKINETSLDKEFKEFMVVDIEEIPEQEEEINNKFKELPLEENLRIKTSIQDPPTDLELKPF
ncbi:hypothetical protein Tco_0567318 [Tanacetum coccineum]